MGKIYNLKKVIALLTILFCFGAAKAQNPINDRVFGQNSWFIDVLNPQPGQLYLDTAWHNLKESGVTQVRIGGIAPNWKPMYTWNGSFQVTSATKLIRLVDSIRKFGMEPIVEVGFAPVGKCGSSSLNGIAYSSQAKIAGSLVSYLNNTIYPTNKIKRWVIANEPDLTAGCSGGYGWSNNSQGHADSIANYIRMFAKEMKDADSSIKIIGPELAMFGTDTFYSVNRIANKLISTSAQNGVMGTITSGGNGNGKYYVDYLTVHYYPTPYTRSAVISDPQDPVNGFEGVLNANTATRKGLVTMINNNGTGRNASNLSIGLTEFNLGQVNADTNLLEDVNLNGVIQGNGYRSFIGGQWLSLMYAVGMNNSSYVSYMNYWSVREGDCKRGMGYISACNSGARKRPSYYHMQMTQHFRGNFYWGNAVTNPTKVKTFAGVENGAGFHIMVLNMDSTTTYNTTNINFNNTAGGSALNITFNFYGSLTPTANQSYTDSVPILARSTVLYEFDCHGTFIRRIDYTEQDALNNQPPALKKFGNVVINQNILAMSPNAIGGTVNTTTVFANDTVYINNDLNIVGNNTKVTFLNSLVVIGKGKKINANPNTFLEVKNSIIIGENGGTWGGITANSNYQAGVGILIDKGVLLNADNAVSTDKLSELQITQSIIAAANGQKAVFMDRGQKFTIDNNLIVGYQSGISTSRTQPNFISKITNNQFVDIKQVLEMVNDNHTSLEVACNLFRGFNKGLVAQSTTLNDQGTASLSAGNVFFQQGTQQDYLTVSGSNPKYYFGPSQSVQFSLPNIVNIPIVQATADRVCTQLFSTTCGQIINPIGIKENALDNPGFIIYPNPNAGNFTVKYSDLPKGTWSINIHDVLGRLITTKKIDSASEMTTLQITGRGMYFVTLQSGDQRITQKVLVE